MTDIHLVVEGLSLCNVTGEGGLPPSMYREVTCERCRQSSAYELCIAMEWLRDHDYDIPEFPQLTISEAVFVLDTYEGVLARTSKAKAPIAYRSGKGSSQLSLVGATLRTPGCGTTAHVRTRTFLSPIRLTDTPHPCQAEREIQNG